MDDDSKRNAQVRKSKARPLLRSAALAVVAVNLSACDETHTPGLGNPKGSWYVAGSGAGNSGGAGGAGGVGDVGGFSGSTSNPKSSWYDAGIGGHAGDDAVDAGDDDAGHE